MSKTTTNWRRQIEDIIPTILIPVETNTPKMVQAIIKAGNDYVLNGGKRLRPLMTLIGHSTGPNQNLTDVLPIACLWELLHGFFLIQDDIMDQDRLRRGQPALHVKLANNKNSRQGESLAILTSDLLYNQTLKIVMESGWTDKQKLKILQLLQVTTQKVIFGQIQDVVGTSKNLPELSDVDYIYQNKTAVYTFVAPLWLGAMLSGTTKGNLVDLNTIGTWLGEIFQNQDDLLNVFGDPGKSGKPQGSDIREQKITKLYLIALNLSSKPHKQTLLRIYSKNNVTEADIQIVTAIFTASGARADVNKSIEALTKRTIVLIETSKIPASTKTELVDIISLLTGRKN